MEKTTNFSIVHHACRGRYAPRDKYLLDQALAFGKYDFHIKDNLLGKVKFHEFPADNKPSDSNVDFTEKSINFFTDDFRISALGFVAVGKYEFKVPLKELSEEQILWLLTSHYENVCNRKGAIYVESKYVQALIDNSHLVVNKMRSLDEEVNLYVL